jgi:hypothetical protein
LPRPALCIGAKLPVSELLDTPPISLLQAKRASGGNPITCSQYLAGRDRRFARRFRLPFSRVKRKSDVRSELYRS